MEAPVRRRAVPLLAPRRARCFPVFDPSAPAPSPLLRPPCHAGRLDRGGGYAVRANSHKRNPPVLQESEDGEHLAKRTLLVFLFLAPTSRSSLAASKRIETTMKVADWDTFAARAARLVESAPLASRCVIKYDHARGGLTVRVTDDTTVRRESDRPTKKNQPPSPSPPRLFSLSLTPPPSFTGPPVRDRPAGGCEAGGAPGGPVHGRGGYGHHAGGR